MQNEGSGSKGVPLERYVFIFSPSTKKPCAVWGKYAAQWTFLTEINNINIILTENCTSSGKQGIFDYGASFSCVVLIDVKKNFFSY